MKLDRRALAVVAATGVASGALAFGGVALASGNSTQSPTATTAAAAATPSATARPGPASGWCDGGPGGRGLGHGMLAGRPVTQAAAAYLGLSQDQLLSQLKAGKSLADVATARGKPVSGLKNAILAAGTSQVNASTTLSAAQKAALISELKSHLDAIVNATFPDGPGMHGGMGGPGRGGWMMGGARGV
jgi:hypothetical protein